MQGIKIPIVTSLREIVINPEYILETENVFKVKKDFYYQPSETYYRAGQIFMFVTVINKDSTII